MAVQIPFAGLLQGLLRISARGRRPLTDRIVLAKLHKWRREVRSFSTGSAVCHRNEADEPEPPSLTSREALPPRRRRPLSPLERISGLLPRDALSPEVTQLREQDQQDARVPLAQFSTPEEDDPEDCDAAAADAAVEDPRAQDASAATLPGERPLAFGEMLLAEYRKKGQVEFRKMFELQPGLRVLGSWGFIQHNQIAGQPAGRFFYTSSRVPILIRRASLEEYVLFMKRGPAIAYPKDACTMLMMMDVTEGDTVLESGSGSGAMSLFLSRAVGSKGRVVSVEIREDHHRRAVLNYKRWRTAWSLRRGEEWPDNVQFHKADLCAASPLLADQGFHAVALDVISPHLVLPTVTPRLHPGAVCAVYLANITQVIDLLDGIRCSALPLLCEHIIEVPIRSWLVAPALMKDGRYHARKTPLAHEDQRDEEASHETDKEETSAQKQPAFGSIPYIARPHPEQFGHSAFLVKLRKYVK